MIARPELTSLRLLAESTIPPQIMQDNQHIIDYWDMMPVRDNDLEEQLTALDLLKYSFSKALG